MRVQAAEAQRRVVDDLAHGLLRGTRRERQPKLLVLVGSRDELVGMRLDADGDADEHVGAQSARGRLGRHQGDLG